MRSIGLSFAIDYFNIPASAPRFKPEAADSDPDDRSVHAHLRRLGPVGRGRDPGRPEDLRRSRRLGALGHHGPDRAVAGRGRGPWPRSIRSWSQPRLAALLEAFPIGAAKTGMLATAAVCTAVADALPVGLPLVVDPVMAATSGGRLLDPDAVAVLVERLLPRAALLTPNLGEAAALVGRPVRTIAEMEAAAGRLRDLGALGRAGQGGPRRRGRGGRPARRRRRVARVRRPALPWDVHGSGCCLSAAIAARLAQGEDLRTRRPGRQGRGHGRDRRRGQSPRRPPDGEPTVPLVSPRAGPFLRPARPDLLVEEEAGVLLDVELLAPEPRWRRGSRGGRAARGARAPARAAASGRSRP